jgi:hypothetical protein
MGALLTGMGRWLGQNLAMAIVFGLSGAAAAFTLNYLLVRFGWVDPAAAPGSGEAAAKRALWLAFGSAVVGALGSYWWTAGTRRLLHAIARFPANIASLLTAAGGIAWVHLLWGAGIAFVVSVAISPAVGLAAGAVALIALPSVLGGIVSSFLFRVWSALVGLVSPVKRHPLDGAITTAIGLAGAVVALAGGFVLRDRTDRVWLALSAIILALALHFVLRARAKP